MYKIPDEILDELMIYHGEMAENNPYGLYDTFLKVTDYKIIKLYEKMAMNPELSESLRSEFIKNNAKIVEYRQISRDELNLLLDPEYNQKVIDEEAERRRREQYPEYYSQFGGDEEKAKDYKEHSSEE